MWESLISLRVRWEVRGGFEQKCEMIWLTFKKNHTSCWIETRLQESKGWLFRKLLQLSGSEMILNRVVVSSECRVRNIEDPRTELNWVLSILLSKLLAIRTSTYIGPYVYWFGTEVILIFLRVIVLSPIPKVTSQVLDLLSSCQQFAINVLGL